MWEWGQDDEVGDTSMFSIDDDEDKDFLQEDLDTSTSSTTCTTNNTDNNKDSSSNKEGNNNNKSGEKEGNSSNNDNNDNGNSSEEYVSGDLFRTADNLVVDCLRWDDYGNRQKKGYVVLEQ